MFEDAVPRLSRTIVPPLVRGAADIAARLLQGVTALEVLAGLAHPSATPAGHLAAAFDTTVTAFLCGDEPRGLSLQHELLEQATLFRIETGEMSQRPLRLLAFAAPGGLQTNTPIEFITRHLNVQLDLLYVMPGRTLPAAVPDHDVAICIVSDSDPETLERLVPLLARWPRPVLNDPARTAGGCLAHLSRDGVARLCAGMPGLTVPATTRRSRAEIIAHLAAAKPITGLLPGGAWPLLARPCDSHAGRLLERLDDAEELAIYCESLSVDSFYLSRFVDYRNADGLYRKYRVAFIAGEAFLCHMAVCEHWMIHYLNAGMTESAAKRADEEAAMAAFDTGFARRHGQALSRLNEALALDYVVLDCAEAPDGSLLLFEVEMAAIIHMLDPPDMFPYKQPQMRRVFAAFEDLLQRAAELVPA